MLESLFLQHKGVIPDISVCFALLLYLLGSVIRLWNHAYCLIHHTRMFIQAFIVTCNWFLGGSAMPDLCYKNIIWLWYYRYMHDTKIYLKTLDLPHNRMRNFRELSVVFLLKIILPFIPIFGNYIDLCRFKGALKGTWSSW